jgi:hypothetical protein
MTLEKLPGRIEPDAAAGRCTSSRGKVRRELACLEKKQGERVRAEGSEFVHMHEERHALVRLRSDEPLVSLHHDQVLYREKSRRSDAIHLREVIDGG